MKKLIVLLIVLCLFGCSNSNKDKLSTLGYNQEDIEIIETYPENIQELFLREYQKTYIELLHCDGFDISKLNSYMKYYGIIDTSKIVEFVNNGEVIESIQHINTNENDDSKQNLVHDPKIDITEPEVNSNENEFVSDPYYIDRNKDIYSAYFDEYGSVRECVEAVNTKSYLDFYSDINLTDTSKNYLMLINKFYGLTSNYVPNDLVDIDSHYGVGQTRFEVYEAYKKLQDDANELGYSFTICSAYRSYDYQEGLYNKYLADEGGNVAVVDSYSARPGHSEHQSGLCLDLSESTYGMDNFGLSEASKWVDDNCYKYGFIIRYTKEKEKVTGYEAEPWQIRYVGSTDIAKDIMDRGITFDEYYAYFVE